MKLTFAGNEIVFYNVCLIGDGFTTLNCSDISKHLGMNYNDLIGLLLNNGATRHNNVATPHFYNKEDVEKTIKILEPYLIMEELIKWNFYTCTTIH